MRATILPDLLAGAAERFPGRTAVVDGDRVIRYADLEREANRVAQVLREAGVRPGDRVGLFLQKSLEAIVAIYGILKAGAAYVPLDPFAPALRLAYITRDCGIRWLLTGWEKAAAWTELAAAGTPVQTLVVLNDPPATRPPVPAGMMVLGREVVDAAQVAAQPRACISQDLAYILYTSGSTGQPKGVMLSHLNALAYVTWCFDYFRPTPEDVFSNHAPLHFDLAILDIYCAAMAGATLVVVPPEVSVFPRQLAAFIERHGITMWYSVPSVLSLLALHGGLESDHLPSVRHVIFAGEVFPTKHLRALMAALPRAQFTNLYGPTETNVCTYYTVPPLPDGMVEPIPIGRAITDVEVFAADDAGQRVAPGDVGELYVRGNTVAYGYWGDAERTARVFVTNPVGPARDRTYRTGDLVRQTSDGDFLFLGRKDHQIKSRGYRIELGDIEAALYAHPAVAECAVIPIPDDVVGNRLKAYVALREGTVTAEALAHFCGRLLPKYMIPEQFEFLSTLPKTSTGKIDRSSLAAARVEA